MSAESADALDGGRVASDVAMAAKLFAAYDRSADGFIDRDEVLAFFSKVVAPGALLRQLKVESIEAAAEAMLKRVDADGDGRIRCTSDPRIPFPSIRASPFHPRPAARAPNACRTAGPTPS